MGILDSPPGFVTGGEIRYKGRDLLTMPQQEQRDIRGEEISIVFQDALSSLNPVFTVGNQIGEMFRRAPRRRRKRGQEGRDRADGPGAHPVGQGAGQATTRTSSPAACGSAS